MEKENLRYLGAEFNKSSKKGSNPVVLWYSPYGLLDSKKVAGGVNDLVLEGKRHLEGKGFDIVTVAPRVSDNSLNVADFNLGETLDIPKLVGNFTGTTLPFSLPFRKSLSRNLIESVQPHILVVEEPTQGFGPHSLLSGMPKREDGKPVAVQVARFHAGIFAKKTDILYGLLVRFAKSTWKRPEVSGGFPHLSFTSGFINTLLKNLDARIAVSSATAKAFEKRFKDNKEYEVIYNGINTEELCQEGEIMKDWKKDGKDIVLCAMGRIEPRKGVEHAVKAFYEIKRERPNTKIFIAGDGPEKKKIEKLANDLGLKDDVKFVGMLKREDYVKALRTADVCICPAVGGEGFGRVVIEPLSVGTPVVLTDIDGYREAVDGGRFFAQLTKPKNPSDIAAKVIKILNLSEEVKNILSWQASSFVQERYSWPIIANQLAKVLEKAYESHGGVKWKDIFVARR